MRLAWMLYAVFLSVSLPATAAGVSRHVAVDAPLIALTRVDLLDGTGSPVRRDQTIIVEKGIITATGDTATTAIPADAMILALPGRTVIPGIVGMHNHLHMPGLTFMPFTAPRLSLASGVTTIRTAGSAQAMDEILLAKAIESGSVSGPRIFPSAPYITGPDGNGPMTKPASAAEARAFVVEWKNKGATWLKLYRHTEPAIAAAIIDEAHRQGLKVAGHLCSLTFREAAELGIDSIEHGLISAADFVVDKPEGECMSTHASIQALDVDDPAVGELIALLVAKDITLVATPAIIESHFPHRPQGDERALAAMSAAWVANYHARQARLDENRRTSRFQPALFEKLAQFERRFVDAGGRLVAGPDPGRHVLLGYGDQRNFELLVEAGFSTAQAVRIMTSNGAEALGAGNQFGTLRAGMQADMVVINGDLASEPAAIRRTEIVFKGGVGYDPAALIEDIKGQVGIR